MLAEPMNEQEQEEQETIENVDVDTVDIETQDENANEPMTETTEITEYKTSYVIEIPSADETVSVYSIALGAVLFTYAIVNLIFGIVRK